MFALGEPASHWQSVCDAVQAKLSSGLLPVSLGLIFGASALQDGSPELSDVEDPGSARQLLQERRVTRAGGSPACATPLKRESDEGDSEQEMPAK